MGKDLDEMTRAVVRESFDRGLMLGKNRERDEIADLLVLAALRAEQRADELPWWKFGLKTDYRKVADTLKEAEKSVRARRRLKVV